MHGRPRDRDTDLLRVRVAGDGTHHASSISLTFISCPAMMRKAKLHGTGRSMVRSVSKAWISTS